jgi:arylsulfatase A-like enzyme
MKRVGIWGAITLTAGILAYLFWPLASRRYEFEFDGEMIARKQEYLESLHRESESPNIILIVADDLAKFGLSLYDGTEVQTPNMDSIGTGGVTFTEGYVSAPVCSPSRAGFITGRYQQRFGYELQPNSRYTRNRMEYLVFRYLIDTGHMTPIFNESVPNRAAMEMQGLPPSEITLSELLQASGYGTAITGKWHLGHTRDYFLPLSRGFDTHYGFYEAFTLYAPTKDPDIVNYRHSYFAIKHIWSQKRNGPCAIVRDDHIIEEPGYLTFRIADEAVDYIGQQADSEQPYFLYVPFSAPHTPFQAPRNYYEMFSHVEDEAMRVYYAMIKALDDAVGMILDAVDGSGEAENTMVLFLSDNGAAAYTGASNAPLKAGKFSYFEGGIAVPIMARWPGVIEPGTVYPHPVSALDVYTTCTTAAELPLPEDRAVDGRNLLPFMTGELSGPAHDALFWRAGFIRAIRTGRWKMLLNDRDGTVLLYDMNTDISESRNLADDNHDIVESLRLRIEEWEAGLVPPAWPGVMDFHFELDGERYDFAI